MRVRVCLNFWLYQVYLMKANGVQRFINEDPNSYVWNWK